MALVALAFGFPGSGAATEMADATEAAAPAQTQTPTLAEIRDQQAEIAAGIEAGEYAHLPQRSISAIKRAQRTIDSVTSGRTDLSELTPTDQVHLNNALSTVKSHVEGTLRARNEQEVCWRERTVGTKIAETRCGTQAELDEARAGARGFMERPRNCTPPDCGAIK